MSNKNIDKSLQILYSRDVFPFTNLLDLLCPPLCPICGEVIENTAGTNEPICSTCIHKIVTQEGQFCRRCGGRRFSGANHADECVRCRTTEFRFKRAIALGEYEHDLRLLALRMKTDTSGISAISAAKALAIYRLNDLKNVQAHYIIPVPMHRLRRRERGVNSPDLLADELGRQLNIPVARQCIHRIRPTDLQYTLSPKARGENVAGAFALRPPSLLSSLLPSAVRSVSPALTNKNILLIDDILTTGSTCNEITKVLLAAGTRSVTVVVVARAAGGYQKSGE